jgi:mannose-1-phosphate guanylyltransferase
MGLKDAIVAASGDGILISDKVQSSYIKPYVDEITGPVMFAEKSWGSFTVLDVQPASMTIRIQLAKGSHINYHSHEHRNEVWTILSGRGRTIVDGMVQQVAPGDVITMEAGCRHTIIADTELKVIEVQLGEEIHVHDKQKFPFPE